jgi:hypothetical protein
MTQLYEASGTVTTGAAAGPIAAFIASASAKPDLREIGLFAATAVSGTILIGRPAANVTTTTTMLGQALDPGDPAATCSLTTVLPTAGTVPANPFRRFVLPATIGAGIVWVWGINELSVAASAQLTLWQTSTAAVTYTYYAKWEE